MVLYAFALENNNHMLNSYAQKYLYVSTGSGQQLVTAVQNKRSPKGLWQIREANDDQFCEAGKPVKCGQVIRLMHLETGSNLHTHGIRSPLSNQHEVNICQF